MNSDAAPAANIMSPSIFSLPLMNSIGPAALPVTSRRKSAPPMWVDPNDAGGANPNVFGRCLLLAGSGGSADGDISVVNLAKTTAGNTAAGTLALSVVHNYTGGGGTATLSCDDNGSNAQAHFIKITAVRGRSLSNVPAP